MCVHDDDGIQENEDRRITLLHIISDSKYNEMQCNPIQFFVDNFYTLKFIVVECISVFLFLFSFICCCSFFLFIRMNIFDDSLVCITPLLNEYVFCTHQCRRNIMYQHLKRNERCVYKKRRIRCSNRMMQQSFIY